MPKFVRREAAVAATTAGAAPDAAAAIGAFRKLFPHRYNLEEVYPRLQSLTSKRAGDWIRFQLKALELRWLSFRLG